MVLTDNIQYSFLLYDLKDLQSNIHMILENNNVEIRNSILSGISKDELNARVRETNPSIDYYNNSNSTEMLFWKYWCLEVELIDLMTLLLEGFVKLGAGKYFKSYT